MIYKLNKTALQTISSHFLKVALLSVLFAFVSCSDEESCEYIATSGDGIVFDCEPQQLNFGDACDSDGDGALDGTISTACECIPDIPILRTCPGFMQNGDFELVTDDANLAIGGDIDLATYWKELWQAGSLADLHNDRTTVFESPCIVRPASLSGGYAGMWVQNGVSVVADDISLRDALFNELITPINQNTGIYTMSFDYAVLNMNCVRSNDVKIAVYGVYFPSSTPLPATPTGIATPSNFDLFGASNTVFLGEVVISQATSNIWTNAELTIDSRLLTIPAQGIDHIMITNSHIPFANYGALYVGLDNFCLIN